MNMSDDIESLLLHLAHEHMSCQTPESRHTIDMLAREAIYAHCHCQDQELIRYHLQYYRALKSEIETDTRLWG